jgi:hypothetical protein
MSTEICKLCEQESTPWFHINGHICDACYYAAKERNKSGWISVKDDLPKSGEWVWIYCGNHPKPVQYYQARLSDPETVAMLLGIKKPLNQTTWFVPWMKRLLEHFEVTHWMRLPEPPHE